MRPPWWQDLPLCVVIVGWMPVLVLPVAAGVYHPLTYHAAQGYERHADRRPAALTPAGYPRLPFRRWTALCVFQSVLSARASDLSHCDTRYCGELVCYLTVRWISACCNAGTMRENARGMRELFGASLTLRVAAQHNRFDGERAHAWGK